MTRILAAAICIAALAGCDQRTRFATFNASLNRSQQGQLVKDLSTPSDKQAQNVAEIIQRVRPDVLLVNEFDFDPDGRAAELFQSNYLSVPHNGAKPIRYEHCVVVATNTGMPSEYDLDNDGTVTTRPGSRGYGGDCMGFGEFPGQYGFVIYSRFPVEDKSIRTYQEFLWRGLPGAMLPTKPDGSPWYSEQALAVLRLSSKNHVDVPISIGTTNVHVLASHPTPPAFDGPEDRNGKRNHDEIRFWSEYLAPDKPAPIAPFVIMGDLNADPNDGGSVPGAIQQLLNHPRVNSGFVPNSDGAAADSRLQAGANLRHKTPPGTDTADFNDESGPGNLRCDYVLPSKDLRVVGGGVFWPAPSDPLHRLVEMKPVASSDHRLVWLDVLVPQQ
ncbi:MAG: endonuclease/exonuclease/phosphatase family protein [Tepidisphaeraceae bacterium]